MSDETGQLVTLAILHENGILAGYQQVPLGEAIEDETHVIVPDGCDLTPGRYRWNGQAFMPVGVSALRGQAPRLSDAELLRALAFGMIAIRDGRPLPEDTLTALARFEASFDAQE